MTRMRIRVSLVGVCFTLGCQSIFSSQRIETDTLVHHGHPWKAAIEVAVINGSIWAFNRYIMNEDFAKVTGASVHRNLHHGLVWDNDFFTTNLLAHPYHGNLYFNAARSCGMEFWQSGLYAASGSLMWELLGEREPPALNDLFATSFGGIALGEVTHRLSHCLWNNDKRKGRFWRRTLAVLVNPMGGVNRWLYGEFKGHSKIPKQLDFSVTTGVRHLSDADNVCGGEYSPFITMKILYGNVFRGSHTPYDYFNLNLSACLSPGQPIVNHLLLTGSLYSWNMTEKSERTEVTTGIYQQFDFWNSNVVSGNAKHIPYRMAETAAIGLGMHGYFSSPCGKFVWKPSLFLDAIFLGGCQTDYYRIIDRDYNMGCGYALKGTASFNFGRRWYGSVDCRHYVLFSWRGYTDEDLRTVNPLYLNTQGDAGHTSFTVLRISAGWALSSHCHLFTEGDSFCRTSHYRKGTVVRYRSLEIRLGMAWTFNIGK